MENQLYVKNGKVYDIQYGVEDGEGNILYWGSPEEMAELGYTPYVEPQESILQRQINDLENSFTDDYKIIKCYEAQLMNRPMPYDYATIIAERDAKRAQINELQAQLDALMNQDSES